MGNISKLHYKSGSVNIIYNSHVLEHIGRNKSRSSLKEWFRVLREGGDLYISVPDLEVLFGMYLDNVNFYKDYDKRKIVDMLIGIIYGGQDSKFNIHYSGYSFSTLSEVLREVGFKKIEKFNPHEIGFLKDVNDASKAVFEGKEISLNIKATK